MRDWYIESFRELRRFKPIKSDQDESTFTDLLRDIYHRHRYVWRSHSSPGPSFQVLKGQLQAAGKCCKSVHEHHIHIWDFVVDS